jgi:hypothetical protein
MRGAGCGVRDAGCSHRLPEQTGRTEQPSDDSGRDDVAAPFQGPPQAVEHLTGSVDVLQKGFGLPLLHVAQALRDLDLSAQLGL